jgi:hypothetical protein
MKNYIWAWRDEGRIYVNKAETLEEIVEEIIEYYLDEESEIVVKPHGKYLQVQVASEEFELDSVIDLNPISVKEFLDELAGRFDREDHFEIMESDY